MLFKLKIGQIRFWYLPIFLISCLFVVIVACGDGSNQSENTVISNSDQANCRLVENVVTSETCLPVHPERIITLAPLLMFHTLTLGIRPVGCSVYWPQDMTAEYLINPPQLGNRADNIRQVGMTAQPNIETILNIKPDLIISYDVYGLTIESQLYQQLAHIAPTVLIPIQGLTNWKDNFNLVAEALNRKDQAQEVWENYYEKIQKIKSDLGSEYAIKEISVAGGNQQDLYAFTRNSGVGTILSDIGFHRPKSQNIDSDNDRFTVSPEKIEDIDGDILFFMLDDANNINAQESIKNHPLWNTLKAVQEEHVYFVDSFGWAGTNHIAANIIIDDLYKYLINPQTNP